MIEFPDKFQSLFEPHRYKVFYGGRGGAKSWAFARALLVTGASRKLRVLCTRETQNSIKESVHHLLSAQVQALGLEGFYKIQETAIKGQNGTEFIFAGIRQQSVVNIKSFEDVDVCWVEEAQVVTKRSWDILIPTIRKPGSEIWISFNPELETDETYKRFVLSPPSGAMVVKVGHQDNPWFPEELRREMEDLKAKSPDDYEHIYEGVCKRTVEGAIYRNEMLAVDKEARILKVPYDATKPVDTFWDLGFSDATCIWFAQVVGFELRLIDYIEGNQQSLQTYQKMLQERPYVYGTHFLPHDARAHQLGTGRSIEEQMRSAGFKVQIVPRLSIADGIAAARAVFPRCYFDADKCADGLQALRHYRYELDDKNSLPEKPHFKKTPLHDWSSNGADAFRQFAVAIREPKRQQEKMMEYVNPYGERGWMA